MAQAVKNLLAMQETQEMWVLSLSWEDPLEENVASHSSVLTWRILWTGVWRATTVYRDSESDMTEHTHALNET